MKYSQITIIGLTGDLYKVTLFSDREVIEVHHTTFTDALDIIRFGMIELEPNSAAKEIYNAQAQRP